MKPLFVTWTRLLVNAVSVSIVLLLATLFAACSRNSQSQAAATSSPAVTASTLAAVESTQAAATSSPAVTPSALVDAPNFAGTWTLRGNPGRLSPATVCVLRQAGNRISGSCKGYPKVTPLPTDAQGRSSPSEMLEILFLRATGSADGVVKSGQISWQWHAITHAHGAIAITVDFDGRLGYRGVLTGSYNFKLPAGLGRAGDEYVADYLEGYRL